jgi:hypothetical protein
MDGGHHADAASRMHDQYLRRIRQAPPPPQKRERPGLPLQALIGNTGSRSTGTSNGSDATAQLRGCAQ